MRTDEYAALDALALAKAVAQREVSVAEVAAAAFDLMRATNPRYNYLSSETAAALNDGAPPDVAHLADGAFRGVPFLVKEGGGLAGHLAFSACRMSQGVRSSSDALFVTLGRRAGLFVAGTSNVPEFCSSGSTEPLMHGPARNPWNARLSTGGSSGGSAAAVVIGAVPVAHGSDGGGSIRIPSALCGAFGLMPTQWRTPSAAGGYGFPIEFTRQHVISRTVRDSAALLDCLGSPRFAGKLGAAGDGYLAALERPLRRLRVAFTVDNPSGGTIDPEARKAVQAVARVLGDLGHDVAETSPAYDWLPFSRDFIGNWYVFILHAISSLEAMTGKRAGPDLIEPGQLAAAAFARTLRPEDVAAQLFTIYTQAQAFSRFFIDFDILVTPTCVGPAPPLGRVTEGTFMDNPDEWVSHYVGELAPHLSIVNAAGQPAMSIPTHVTPDGLPVGVHLVGRHDDELTLLQIARAMEQALPWRSRGPAEVASATLASA
jgi:amidase